MTATRQEIMDRVTDSITPHVGSVVLDAYRAAMQVVLGAAFDKGMEQDEEYAFASACSKMLATKFDGAAVDWRVLYSKRVEEELSDE